MKRGCRLGRFASILCALLIVSGTGRGQSTGSISGRVVDPSAQPLQGATVEAVSEHLQGTRTAQTSRDGVYHFPAVPPGDYRVRATLPGFRTVEKGLTVTLDGAATVDLTLPLAAEAQVLVSGEAPLVDTTSTTTGTSYTSQVASRLPVGRNYAALARLNPGASTDLGKTQGRVLPLTINGSTSAENLWLIEGVNTTDVVYGTQGKLLSDEFVQEVEVKTGGYQAEYGGALGGVINVVTKSGGNTFHGGAFVYYDSGATRAQPVYLPGVDLPAGDELLTAGNHFDFGVSLGGFLVKDRLWFYGMYNRVNSPTTITNRVDPADPAAFPLDTDDSLYGGKLTVNVSNSTTVVGTVFSDPTRTSGAACGDPIVSSDPGSWQCERSYGGLDAALRLDQLLGPRVFMSLQASRHRDGFGTKATGEGAAVQFVDKTCEGGTPEVSCSPADPPNSVTGGLGFINGPTNNAQNRRLQFGGSATFYTGNHEVKAGAEYQQIQQESVFLYTGGQKVTRMNEYGQEYYRHDFFARSREDLTPVDAPHRPRGDRFGFYVQDAFRATANLTINAGFRWDQQAFRSTVGATILETSNEWQPRLGVAWDPWKDGKTRVYASAGRFSYALPLDFTIGFASQITASTYNFDPVGLDQASGVINYPVAVVRGNEYSEPVDAGLKGIYQDELTVGFERALTPTFSIGIKGTYRSFGRTIEDRCDLDPAGNNGSNCAITNPGSSGRYARGDMPACNGLDDPYHACSATGAVMAAAKRIYRGIEVVARKSVGDSFWVQASYVYSSLRGNYDGLVSASGQTDPGILADFDYPQYSRNNYGTLAGDHPHSARLDLTYTFPLKAFIGLGAYVQSGGPQNRLGFAHNLDTLPFLAPVYLVPRGSEGRLPTLWEADLTAGYPFPVGPVTVTAQVYLFNLFNNQLAIGTWPVYRRSNLPGYPDTIYTAVAPTEYQSPRWDKVEGRQDPRLFRASLRVSF